MEIQSMAQDIYETFNYFLSSIFLGKFSINCKTGFCRMICLAFISRTETSIFLFSVNVLVLTKANAMINTSLGDSKNVIFVLFYGVRKDKNIINVNYTTVFKIFEEVIHSSMEYLRHIF